MSLHLSWLDIGVRLVLTLMASGLIGLDRERNHAAGLRTTILVCMAASVAMIEVNILLTTSGKTPDSFVQLDAFRLPLGILSGIGFIGAGAILRRNEMVTGVTTAATLWMVTVIGLCLGSGALGLGCAAAVLSLAVLWPLQWLEKRLPHCRSGKLTIAHKGQPRLQDVTDSIRRAGIDVRVLSTAFHRETNQITIVLDVQWRAPKDATAPDRVFDELREDAQIVRVEWLAEASS